MADADQPISVLGRRRHRRAVEELVNAERRARGLRELRHSRLLSVSARAWARTLTARSRFAHGDFARRVLRFPFVLAARGSRWRVGENLAWGSGPASSPRRIVAAWMASPEHRRNVLGAWRSGAVWSLRDAPEPGRQRDSVTVVHHLGSRGR